MIGESNVSVLCLAFSECGNICLVVLFSKVLSVNCVVVSLLVVSGILNPVCVILLVSEFIGSYFEKCNSVFTDFEFKVEYLKVPWLKTHSLLSKNRFLNL